jgi:hypothetical protein
MLNYCHNTTADNKDNIVYAYLTNFGDLCKDPDLLCEPVEFLKVKIIVEAGLLGACTIEEFDDFIKKKAIAFLKKQEQSC